MRTQGSHDSHVSPRHLCLRVTLQAFIQEFTAPPPFPSSPPPPAAAHAAAVERCHGVNLGVTLPLCSGVKPEVCFGRFGTFQKARHMIFFACLQAHCSLAWFGCSLYYVTELMRLSHAHPSAPAPFSDIISASSLLSVQHLCSPPPFDATSNSNLHTL